jgi:uncharacterized protein
LMRSNSLIPDRILAVKLQLAGLAARNSITGYGAGYILVNGARHEENVILMPDRVLPWKATDFGSLAAGDFEELARLDLEVVLLGTGPTLRFPAPELTRPLVEARIGLEVMDVQAACRTYNILASEERRVAAALLLR